MATYTKFQGFIEHLAHGVHNFASDAITVALTNTAPSASLSTANTILSQITEIDYTYCSSRLLSNNISVLWPLSPYYYKFAADPEAVILTASGGSVGPFRYAVLYNDTPSSPLNP